MKAEANGEERIARSLDKSWPFVVGTLIEQGNSRVE